MNFSFANSFFIFLIYVSVIMCSSVTNFEFRKAVRECKDISGVTENLVSVLINRKYPENDPLSYCTLGCVFKKMNGMNPNNTVNEEGFVKTLEKIGVNSDRTLSVAQLCKTKVGNPADECQAAKLLISCYNSNI